MNTISRPELEKCMDQEDSITLVEALPLENFQKGHLPGAINIPRDEVKTLAGEMLPDKNAEIVVYCAGPTCPAAEETATELERLGYRHVRDFTGGKEEWVQAGLPLEQ